MSEGKDELHGALLVAFATSIWGCVGFFRKLILIEVSPILMNFLNCGLMVAVVMIFFPVRVHVLLAGFRRYPFIYLSHGVFGGALGITLLYCGLDRLDLGVLNLFQRIEPIFVLLLAHLFLGERMSRGKLPFVALAIAASYCVVTPDPLRANFSEATLSGVFFVIGAAMCLSISTVLGKTLVDREVRPREIIVIRFFLSTIFLLPVFVFRDALALEMNLSWAVLGLLVLAAVLTVYAFNTYYTGLKHIPAGVAGFMEMFTPLTAVLLGVTLLDETLSLTQWMSIPVLLLAVYFIQRRPAERLP